METPVNENGLIALSELERTNLSSGEKTRLFPLSKTQVAFIRNALSNKENVDRAYLGKISEETARLVLSETGIDISGYHAVLGGDAIRHMVKHYGDQATEANRGQAVLSPEAIAQIPQIPAAPDKISLSVKPGKSGQASLIFEKELNGYYISIQAVSKGSHSIQAKTLYIRKKDPLDTVSHADASASARDSDVQNVPPSGLSSESLQQSEPEVKSAEQVELLTRKPAQQELDPLVLAIQAPCQRKFGSRSSKASRAAAVKEAQKATFRDANRFSDFVSEAGRASKSDSPVPKGIAAAVDAWQLFRRTPANIAVRGLEYGPAGFLKAITYDFIQFRRGKGRRQSI